MQQHRGTAVSIFSCYLERRKVEMVWVPGEEEGACSVRRVEQVSKDDMRETPFLICLFVQNSE